jgi:hypothetical protein
MTNDNFIEKNAASIKRQYFMESFLWCKYGAGTVTVTCKLSELEP